MDIRISSKIGYDAKKDVTFFRTNTLDFDEQLYLPTTRGSSEDLQIRALLEDQGVVDFAALNATVKLPTIDYDVPFGLVGGEEEDELVPQQFTQFVLFGKEGSGAINLVRFWLLWANQTDKRVVTVGTPDDLYGSYEHMNSNLIHRLDPTLPLRDQFDALDPVQYYNGAQMTLFLVGSEFEAVTLEDRLFLKEMQNGAYSKGEFYDEERVFSLIHRAKLLESTDDYFTGSDGSAENVSYAVIGDVNEATAKKVGDGVPARNARGVAWLSREGKTKRVKTYLVPHELVVKGASWNQTPIY